MVSTMGTMIVIRVELFSAITGRKTELARMEITNVSGGGRIRDYEVRTLRGRSTKALNRRTTQRSARIDKFPSLSRHVWALITKALIAMGYDR